MRSDSRLMPAIERSRSSGRSRRAAREELGVGADGGERRAQLVRRVGDEAAQLALGRLARAGTPSRSGSSIALSASPSRPTSVRVVLALDALRQVAGGDRRRRSRRSRRAAAARAGRPRARAARSRRARRDRHEQLDQQSRCSVLSTSRERRATTRTSLGAAARPRRARGSGRRRSSPGTVKYADAVALAGRRDGRDRASAASAAAAAASPENCGEPPALTTEPSGRAQLDARPGTPRSGGRCPARAQPGRRAAGGADRRARPVPGAKSVRSTPVHGVERVSVRSSRNERATCTWRGRRRASPTAARAITPSMQAGAQREPAEHATCAPLPACSRPGARS